MIRPEAVIALRAYTTLPRSIQGMLTRRTKGFELSGDVSEDMDFAALAAKATQKVHCVSAANFHSGLMDPGTPATGPFVFRGCSLQEKDGIVVAVARVLKGTVPAGFAEQQARQPDLLVSFRSTDVTQCWGGEELLFGTTTVLGALAPPWAYVRPVVDGSAAQILAPCVNGCYLLERLNTGGDKPSALADAEAMYNALLRMDVLAMLGGTVPASAPCIYRLAQNAVVVAPDGSRDKIEALQVALRIPTQPASTKLVTTTSFTLYQSVASAIPDSQYITPDQLAAAVGAGTSVLFQPLERWQLPRRRLTLTATLTTAAPATGGVPVPAAAAQGLGAIQDLQMRPTLGDRMLTGVSISVRCPVFNLPRPGESAKTQTEQLERIVQSSVDTQLAATDVSHSQAALDAFTSAFTRDLETQINATSLYGAMVRARCKADLLTTHGESVRLPDGGTVVIPEYALSETSARICVFTGGLAALGVKATFHPWRQIRQGFAI